MPAGKLRPASSTDATKADKVGTSDIEITDATKGPILRTAEGARARIHVATDAGIIVLKTEAL